MALKPVRPRLRNISNDVAKVQLVVAAGDELEVSEDVAAQLAHQGAPFREAAPASKAEDPAPDEPKPVKAKGRTGKRA